MCGAGLHATPHHARELLRHREAKHRVAVARDVRSERATAGGGAHEAWAAVEEKVAPARITTTDPVDGA